MAAVLDAHRDEWADLVERAWQPSFPSPDLVHASAALLPSRPAPPPGPIPEGPVWRLQVGPGVLAVGTRDYARAERTDERTEDARQHLIEWEGVPRARLEHYLRTLVLGLAHIRVRAPVRHPDLERAVLTVASSVARRLQRMDRPPTRVITEWSRKSRARMVRRFCELDYTPLFADDHGTRHGRLPAMLTLTYPGDWLTVAPNGKAAKAHLRAFRERWRRAWGEHPYAIWKLEFQRRGAPHFHLLTIPPHGTDEVLGVTFRPWLSRVWAEIVDHPDPDERARHLMAGTGIDYAEGLRASDPRRVAAYFLKHNTAGPEDKEYQHLVPDEWQAPGQGPGRFWGAWNLDTAVSTVEVTPDTAVAASRVMRRWSRAQGRLRTVTRPRTAGGRWSSAYPTVDGLTGAQALQAPARTRYRRTRVRCVQVERGRGWIAVNDGPSFAADLARYLSSLAPA